MMSSTLTTASALVVRDGGIDNGTTPILHHLNFEIPFGAVTAILGPAGGGKSHLLRAFNGALEAPWRRTGEWHQAFGASVFHLRQPRSGEPCDWRRAFDDPQAVVLLDETDRVAVREDRYELAYRILVQARRGAVVLVTHDLTFAREVSDFVYLVVAGEIIESGDARSFFSDPKHPLAQRFVKTGNCWPAAQTPALPAHFRWIMPGKLAGMARPGLLRDEEDDLISIATAGITLLVSLTERAFPNEKLRPYGIHARHFPINDMSAPALDPTARLCRAIEKHIEGGQAAAVHCRAGLGRTGLILASFLVWQGEKPDVAIVRVRAAIEGAIQTSSQAAFVHRFASFV